MQKMIILVLLGTYSEVAKKSSYAVSRQIREQFDTALLAGIHKPPCTEAILWDPDIGEYNLLCNELHTA
jgi:hypothetical protein